MKLSELIETTELRIPTDSGADVVVQLKRELSWFEQLALNDIKDEGERGRYLALKLIDSWNITDDSSLPLPVTRETLEKLPPSVMLPIVEKIVEMAKEADVKKKSLQRT